MLASLYFGQTSRRLIINSSRATLSTLPYPKSSETQAASDGTGINYPTGQTTPKHVNVETIAPNDILEAQRLEKQKPVLTSTDKFVAGLSSKSPTGIDLFQDTKVSNTLVLPGIPITATLTPLANERQPLSKEEQHEQIPSSRFSAFLRSIRSGLPFFPSKKNSTSSMNIATTREHFIPVGYFYRRCYLCHLFSYFCLSSHT
jgi:hypothetical protein